MRHLFMAAATAAVLAANVGGGALAQPPGPQGQGGTPGGPYQQNCRNAQYAGGSPTAECAGRPGQNAQNQNQGQGQGQGQNYRGPGYANQGDPNRGYQNHDYRGQSDHRDNNGAAVAGFFAGALLGGALAGEAGAPPPPPPPPPPGYGDPRYGDPRYDWRYQQGGYGYGRRPGEWVPIADRADWLNRQIDRLQRDGRIDYSDARDYRRQLDGIAYRERDMMRYGRLGPRQRDELDHRFNDLAEEIRHDARED